MSYILGAKPKDHTYLFDWIETSPQTYQTQEDDGTNHHYRYHNKVPLNDAFFWAWEGDNFTFLAGVAVS